MGLINNIEKVNMWGGHTHWDLEDDAHGIAIIAQSGFVSAEILNTDFFNVSYAISSGNGNICTLEDFLDFVIQDEKVRVVALYLEGVRNSRRFLEALRRAAELRKPVVILKAGRSAIGAIAAASHTGSMAGSSKAFESIFEKYGVIVARTLEEFMCLAQTMSVLNGNFPKKKEFAVISFSGGESTLSADVAEETGVALAELSEETKAEIKKYIPGFAAAKNPLDATTSLFHDDDKTIGLLKAFQADEAVGAITIGTNVKNTGDATTNELCGAIAKAKAQGVTKPVLAIPSLENYRYRESRRVLENAGVPLMSSMGTSFSCLKQLSDFAVYDASKRTLIPAVPEKHDEGKSVALSEFDSKAEMLVSISVSYDAFLRYQSAKDVKTARWGCIWGGIITMFIGTMASAIGVVGQQLNPSADAGSIFATTVSATMSPVLAGIVVTAVLAAAMSSGNGLLICMGASFSRDLYNKMLHPDKELDELPKAKTIAQITIVGACLVGIFFAFKMDNVLDAIILFNYPYMGSMLVPLYGALLDKNGTVKGCFAGMIGGAIVGTVCFLAGIPSPLQGLFNPDMGLFAAYAVALVLMVIVSSMDKNKCPMVRMKNAAREAAK